MRAYLVVLVLLAGCTPPKAEWTKTGSSQADFQRDHGVCAEKYKSDALLMGQMAAVQFEKCMNKLGWTGKFDEGAPIPK